ncbi:hypothetical protein QEH56_12280 [Pelagicoccus enzymogenes]|uniref:hypothetical protein n=1 Tax=Pelagicoccus enzymogenes TaxID=2773457 RepID=UPI00280D9241|nr:hypothetical protein [Pelagicoccus enzymogenes]MDQ8198934.1 hypothetical protein [Pelagicoccus enzymogenes]
MPLRHLPIFLLAAATHLSAADFQFPPEGRWSVASAWQNNWPEQWSHASPERSETVGEWTIHYGHIDFPSGRLELRDSERQRDDGLLELRRRWTWTGEKPLETTTLSVRIQSSLTASRPILPGISYYDNPAGQAIDPTRIPVIGESPGDRGYYEEHRFPMPLSGAEGKTSDGKTVALALHSLPSPIAQGVVNDQWWSLGFERISDNRVEFAALSGPVASNGKSGIIKGEQKRFIDYPDAYCVLQPGDIVDKTVFLQPAESCQRGFGLSKLVHASLALFNAYSTDGYTPYKEILDLKMRDSASRWREDAQFAGIHAFPGPTRPWIDLGWAGQSEAVAYPFILLGKIFQTANAKEIAQKAMDFIATSPFTEDGFSIRYHYGDHQWLDRRNPLSQGQTMNNMFNALRAARAQGGYDTAKWESFLLQACQLHADRILQKDWRPVSTNEGFLIAPLAQGAELLGNKRFLKAARKAADHYRERHLSMEEPYWGGTLDARCEDKEGAWAALQGFLTLYEISGDKKYLTAAEHAADVVLSYMYVWDVPMPPGRLADHAFRSRGWTSVSVQNMHLDVYGVLCAPAFWKLGELTGRDTYKKSAKLLTVPCGQLTDPWGSAGEQLHQTTYAQHYNAEHLHGVRGDYIESWNVYWITAHFLTAAAQFAEMGVDVTKW